MPFHLLAKSSESAASPANLRAPGPTRRDFLGGAAAAGASLALGVTAGADAPSPWYAFLSDVHIAADPAKENRGQVMAENLRTVVADIGAMEGSPEGVFVDGDLALADGGVDDYQTFLTLIEPLRKAKAPIHLALGNHDHRANFREVLHGLVPAETQVVDKQVGVVDGPGLRFVVLDSLDQINVAPGKVGRPQLDWLAAELDRAPNVPTLIFVHHNLTLDNAMGLTDTKDLLELVQPRRQAKGVIFGHTHVWNVRQEDGLHLINLPAVAYPFSPTQPLGWCRFQPEPGGGHLELRCVGGNRRNDRQKVTLRWRTD